MTTGADPRPEPAKGAGPDEIEADIDATRERLAETVDALGERFDVKARARQAANDAGPALPIAAVAVVVVVVAIVIWKKRR